MAERKIFDLWGATIVGVFFLAVFSSFFLQADKLHGLDNIGSELEGLSNTSNSDYALIEQQIEDDTFNTSTFTIRENQFIDTRGTAQDFVISKDTTNTNKGFLVNVGRIIKQPLIMTFLISMLILVGIKLFFRFWKPGGA